MTSKLEISKELRELRAAYGMCVEEFAAVLSLHLGTVLVPPHQLRKWEAGKGPSSEYRSRLEPVLKRFREHLAAQSGEPPTVRELPELPEPEPPEAA